VVKKHTRKYRAQKTLCFKSKMKKNKLSAGTSF